ncbi:hypothetical protein NYE37_03845 [Thermoactinomyces sp. FSL K6-2592]|jgi:hypothetical protein|uniref:hypothetical protein n=1 Tax=Thermoactinomyces sp. FSL K6-2592 TaxID=2975347 RepID=UPI0030F7D7F2
MKKIHSFQEKLKEGEAFERELDNHFSKWYQIEKVNIKTQRKMGIDRIFKNRFDGKIIKVEYKADSAAGKTGNIFVETISNSKSGAEGWAIKCQADIVIYFIPMTGELIAVRPIDILLNLPRWIATYKKAPAFNSSYRSFGRLVPIEEFKKQAVYTRKISIKQAEAS